MAKSLRIAFMGTPDFAASFLSALIASHHDVVCVYSQPPRPKGRGKQIQKSPVHVMAEASGIEERTPVNFKGAEDIQAFRDLNLDVAVVAAYGLILPQAILDAPKHGCINIHASLLPRWRGAAPIHRAILAGDTESGITLMQMDTGLDTGDMIAVKKVPITETTTSPMLQNALVDLGEKMIVDCLDDLANAGSLNKTPQPDVGVTYAHKLTKEEGHIDWTQSASNIEKQLRALHPWPGTWCMNDDKRLKILAVALTQDEHAQEVGTILEDGKVACGNGTVLQLLSVQPENKKPMDIQTALNGGHIQVGNILS